MRYLHCIPQSRGVVGVVAHRRHAHSLRTNKHLSVTQTSSAEAQALTDQHQLLNMGLFLEPNPPLLFLLVLPRCFSHWQVINRLKAKQRWISKRKSKASVVPCWAERLGGSRYRRPRALSWSRTGVDWEGNCREKTSRCSRGGVRAAETIKITTGLVSDKMQMIWHHKINVFSWL